ncbi:hypothetical protein U1Q18_041347 [Sarracenia purpurea var. burkii]
MNKISEESRYSTRILIQEAIGFLGNPKTNATYKQGREGFRERNPSRRKPKSDGEDSEGERARPEVIDERDRRGSEKNRGGEAAGVAGDEARLWQRYVRRCVRRSCFGCIGAVRRNKILVRGLGFGAGRKTN